MWQTSPEAFLPVAHVNRSRSALLKGIDRAAEQLLDNTRRFAAGLPANNALLWGARGMGKSSLVKAAQAEVRRELELGAARAGRTSSWSRSIARTSPRCRAAWRTCGRAADRFIVFCDDLSFDKDDTSYKSLKAVLEGGIEGRPEQRAVLRHLQPPPPDAARHDGERALDRDQSRPRRSRRRSRCPTASACGSASTTPPRTSTSTWCAAMRAHHKLDVADDDLRREALEWSMTRGARSGRVAWQFIQDLAGRLGQRL